MWRTLTRNALCGLCWRLYTQLNVIQTDCPTTNHMKTRLTLQVSPFSWPSKTYRNLKSKIPRSVWASYALVMRVALCHCMWAITRPPSSCQLVSDWGGRQKQALRMGENLSRLVRGRINGHCAAFVCNHCLHQFRNKDTLDRHIPIADAMPRKTRNTQPQKPERMYFRIP